MNPGPARPTLVTVAVLLAVAGTGCATRTIDPTTAVSERTGTPRQIVPRAPAHLPPAQSEDGTTSPLKLDDPTIANLNPNLREAVEAAAEDASAASVRFWVTSGWRSRAKQQSLLEAAVTKYGSLDEALRYVSTPDKSAHVSGHAVDIGPAEADYWLARHGSDYGLCQIFANEIWHFELATEPGGVCPATIPASSYR